MAMDRDTALVTTLAEVANLTSLQQLDNLESGGDLTIVTLLLNAHRAIYDELVTSGIDPALISNQSYLKGAIAWEAALVLASDPKIELDPLFCQARRDEALRRFRPIYVDSTSVPRNSTEGVPEVANFDDGFVFGPGPRRSKTQLWDDLPGFH